MPVAYAQPEVAQSSEAFPSQQELSELLEKTKATLVNQYPQLASNPNFKSELDDAFSKFVNEGVQIGTDPNEVWTKTVAPVMQKWAAQAPRDISKNFSDKQRSFDALRASGVPAFQASEAVPDVLDTRNPFHVSDQAVINRDINAGNRPARMDALTKADLETAVKKYQMDKGIVDTMGAKAPPKELQQLESDRKAVLALEGSAPSAGTKTGTNAAAALNFGSSLPNENSSPFPIAPRGSPVASPQGTSGYVGYDEDGNRIMPSDGFYELGGKRTNLGDGQPQASAASALNPDADLSMLGTPQPTIQNNVPVTNLSDNSIPISASAVLKKPQPFSFTQDFPAPPAPKMITPETAQIVSDAINKKSVPTNASDAAALALSPDGGVSIGSGRDNGYGTAQKFRDKSGTVWNYVGSAPDPSTDKNPNNWQVAQQ